LASLLRIVSVQLGVLYSASTNQLLLASENEVPTFLTFPPCPIRRRPKNPARAFSDIASDTVPTLPMDAVPVEYWEEPDQYVIPDTISSLAFDPPVPPSPAHWKEYIQTLPIWEQELLFSVTIVDRSRLFTALRSAEVLLLASDGGATDKLGSYGALMATQDHILIECGGRAQGANPRSFRAEGYGILAVLRLVFRLRHFYITRNASLRFRLYCDSESLLKRIAASRALTRIIPRRFLPSEVDVEMQILAAVAALEADVAFEHVEGHQDTKYPGRPLPRAAQLNQRCDEIATTHLDSATCSIPSVRHLSPREQSECHRPPTHDHASHSYSTTHVRRDRRNARSFPQTPQVG
jgi:hypothetical protein